MGNALNTYVVTLVHNAVPYQVELDADSVAQAQTKAAEHFVPVIRKATGQTLEVATVITKIKATTIKAVPKGH